eukprot:3588356-Pyramimonas_sp.AAC.1
MVDGGVPLADAAVGVVHLDERAGERFGLRAELARGSESALRRLDRLRRRCGLIPAVICGGRGGAELDSLRAYSHSRRSHW